MKFHSLLPVALICLAACTTVPSAPSERPETTDTLQTSDNEPLINRSEVLAVVTSSDTAIALEQSAARWGYDLRRKEALSGLGVWLLTFNCPPGIDPEVATRELERLTPQAEVEVNHRYTLSVSQSVSLRTPIIHDARHYANALVKWPDEGCEAQHRIGLIDGAVSAESLPSDTRIVRRDFVAHPAAADHGTAVAQLIVGAGRLRKAELYAASVVSAKQGSESSGYSGVEPILKALDWMVREQVTIVNVSLAGPYNATLEEGFRRAADRGVTIVAAVGNEGPSAKPRFPAALDPVIATTAVDAVGHVYDSAVQGAHVDVSAPGVEVFVSLESGGKYMTGTSLAAPFVTAALAATMNANPAAELPEMTLDLGSRGHDPVYGYGLLNAGGFCR